VGGFAILVLVFLIIYIGARLHDNIPSVKATKDADRLAFALAGAMVRSSDLREQLDFADSVVRTIEREIEAHNDKEQIRNRVAELIPAIRDNNARRE